MFPISYKDVGRSNPQRDTLRATYFQKNETKPEFSCKYHPILEDYLSGKWDRFSSTLKKALEKGKLSQAPVNRPLFMNAFLLTLKLEKDLSKYNSEDIEKRFMGDFRQEKPIQNVVCDFRKALEQGGVSSVARHIFYFLDLENLRNRIESKLLTVKKTESTTESFALYRGELTLLKGFLDRKDSTEKSYLRILFKELKDLFFDPDILKRFNEEEMKKIFEKLAVFFEEACFSNDDSFELLFDFCNQAERNHLLPLLSKRFQINTLSQLNQERADPSKAVCLEISAFIEDCKKQPIEACKKPPRRDWYSSYLERISNLPRDLEEGFLKKVIDSYLDPFILKTLTAEEEEQIFEAFADSLEKLDASEDMMVDLFVNFCEKTGTTDGSVFLSHSSFKYLSTWNDQRVSKYRTESFYS